MESLRQAPRLAARRPTVRYQYDSLDRLQKVSSDPDGFGSGQLASETEYLYDIYSRLEQVKDPEQNVTRYGYDLAGQLTSLRDPSGNETLWAHDGPGRQKFETNQLDHSRFFEYDTVGNLLRRTDRNGRLIQSNGNQFCDFFPIQLLANGWVFPFLAVKGSLETLGHQSPR